MWIRDTLIERDSPYVIFWPNTAYQESTKMTPFFLVYGREAIIPNEYINAEKEHRNSISEWLRENGSQR